MLLAQTSFGSCCENSHSSCIEGFTTSTDGIASVGFAECCMSVRANVLTSTKEGLGNLD
jgi:hypothetical protein